MGLNSTYLPSLSLTFLSVKWGNHSTCLPGTVHDMGYVARAAGTGF